MKPQDVHSPNASASDRRGEKRKRAAGKVRLSVAGAELEGELDNLSSGGVLFFTGADLRVSVQLEQDGQLVARSGRLVRATRVRPGHVGWAIEFD